MKHSITVEASILAESLKAAQNYVKKDISGHDALGYLLLTYLPKDKKLVVIACDGHGYFERRLPVILEKKGIKPSLPGQKQFVCISPADSQSLVKLIPARMTGRATLEIEENDNLKHGMSVKLPTGASATFTARTDMEVPDYGVIRARACKGKLKAARLTDVNIPIHEMLRAGRSLPVRSGSVVKASTAEGSMMLLEYQDDSADIKIIFTFAKVAEAA